MAEKIIETRSTYRHFRPITTRWADNDIYGHVNNVIYYAWFDSAVNGYMIEQGGLDIHGGSTVGFVVESSCTYNAPVTYPDVIEAGLRVGRIGKSSVRHEIGIFREGEAEAAASGYFIHVFVDRVTSRPVEIPAGIRSALEAIQA
ncbi:MAG: thioesterase family protein [Rhodospirillales bacterium]